MKKFIIDRFEESYAVLENLETRETESRPRAELPKGAKSGDMIELSEDGTLRINKEATAARAANIRARFNKLIGK